MRALLFSLLVGCVLAESSEYDEPLLGFGNRIELQPSHGGYPSPTGPPCQPLVVYRTQVKYSTVVIPSNVYEYDVLYKTRTSLRNHRVFSTLFSEIIDTQIVPRLLYRTVVETHTQDNLQTQLISLPGRVNYVTQTSHTVQTQTQYRTRFVTRTRQVHSTFTSQIGSTHTVTQQIFRTLYQTRTQTRTSELPGNTRTVQSTRLSTVLSTVFVPGRTETRTQFVTSTNYITRTISQPGHTQIITSTRIIPVTTTFLSIVVDSEIQTQFVTRTQFQQQVTTFVQTQRIPQFNTRTVTVPRQVIKTHFSTEIVPSTILRQQLIPSIVYLPANTRFHTIFETVVKSIQLPGRTRTQFQTETVFNTNYITSTVVNKQYVTVTATQRVKPYCKLPGPKYPSPTPIYSPYGH